jgi:DNA-binding SARP family transcriptional activator/class 3 adenylate cyclase
VDEPANGAVTFLLTDIEGSTTLWDVHEAAMRAAIARHNQLLDQLIAAHGGRVFKFVGDGVYSNFERPRAALDAALAIQQAVQASSWGELGELRIRVALHFGEAEQGDGDYVGPTVNRAARLLSTAAGSEIVASEVFVRLVEHDLPDGVAIVSLGERTLRGIRGPLRVCQVIPPSAVQGGRPASTSRAHVSPPAELAPASDGDEARRALLAPPAGAVQVYTLGRFRVEWNGRAIGNASWGRPGAQALFKCLISRSDRRLTRDRAAELLWPDTPHEDARASLRGAVFALRRRALASLGHPNAEDLIVSDHVGVAIQHDGRVWVDADAFERAVGLARDAETPEALLEAAATLYGGEYLPDDPDEVWATGRRESLKRAWSQLRFALAERYERAGSLDAAAAALEPLFSSDPCDEHAARELMRLHARLGQVGEALRVFNRLERALADELGARPSHETLDLRRRIVGRDEEDAGIRPRPARPALPGPDTPRPSEPRPELGHVPFARRPSPSSYVTSYPLPTPVRLVGRARELSSVDRVVHTLTHRAQATGQIVLIGAPAGTGKSALLGVLVQRARRAGALCLVGGSHADRGIGPFYDALTELLLSQPPEQLKADLGGFASDLADVVPELRYHLGLADRPPSGQDRDLMRLFGAVHAYLRGLAEQGPVLLALEDVHTAIAGSLQLIRYLVRHTRNLSLLIVATYRSDEVERGGALAELITWLERDRLGERWLPGPLNRDQTADLAAALLDGPLTSQLAESIHVATDGNPLFIEQLVLALTEAGRIGQRSGHWDGAIGDGHGLTPVMRDVIDQRFGRLSRRCQEMLALAAVLGQTVPHPTLLAADASGDETGLLSLLDEALDARMLQETPAGYAFKHAIVRDAIYSELSGPAKMRLHRRAGETLERLAGDRVFDKPAELAYHFSRAGASPEIVAKALRYNLEAARWRAAISEHSRALTSFNGVCELLEAQGDAADPAIWLEALEGRVNAERALWLWMPLIADAQRLLRLATEPSQRARARSALGFAQQQTGDTTAALSGYEAALRELEGVDQTPEIVVVRLRLQYEVAYIWFLQGRFIAMLVRAEEILRVALDLGQPRPRFWAHNIVALAHFGSGRVDPAVHHFELAAAAAAESEDKVDLAIAHSNLGLQCYLGGRFAEAKVELERAIALYRDATADRRTANPMQALGRVWLAQGDVERAREHGELACAIATEAQDRWEADCHDLLGMIHGVRAEWGEAERQFNLALKSRERVDHAHSQIETLIGLGLVYERRGDWPLAHDFYERAVTIAGAIDPNPWAVAARRHLGALLTLVGEDAAAAQLLDRALVMAEAMPQSVEYPLMLLALAELDWRGDGPEAALQCAEQALAAGIAAERTAEACINLAGLLNGLGRPEEARSRVAEALALAEVLASPRLVGLAHLTNARLAVSRANAIISSETAIDVLTHADLPYERASALKEHAQLICAYPTLSERARTELAEALGSFRQLGARPAEAACAELIRAVEA